MNKFKQRKGPDALVSSLFYDLLLIRRVEERLIHFYPTDRIKSPIHLSIGQESVSVGVCHALDRNDVVFGTYRGHALYLAKKGNLNAMMAELYGKRDGFAQGKAGSMHFADVSVGMMGTSAIVATTIPQAVGYALAIKMRGEDRVVAVFFGDGATDEGVFHESLNFAALKKLPILFICENNLYAIYSNIKNRMPKSNICERAEAYHIPAQMIKMGDVFDIYNGAHTAIEEIRSGGGPRFIECMTYRWRDHVGPDEDFCYQYRTKEELQPWVEHDQVSRLAKMLSTDVRGEIELEVERKIAAAIEFAELSNFPEKAELERFVYA